MTKQHHDIAEVRDALRLRKAEGLTFEQLADRTGIAVHVLTYRASQDRRKPEPGSAPAGAFLELVPARSDPAAPADHGSDRASRESGIELLLPGGLRAQLARDFDDEALGRLLAIARC